MAALFRRLGRLARAARYSWNTATLVRIPCTVSGGRV